MWLTGDFNKQASDLMNSRILRKPIGHMKKIVRSIMSDKKPGPLKYMIYSSHDTQIVQMMDYLRLQSNFFFTPFASNIIFELKYSESCLADANKANEDCFGVGVSFNGTPQIFDGCTGDNFSMEGCKWSEFLSYMGKIWYSGVDADDLDAACQQDVN